MIRIVLAEDHHLVRKGIVALLEDADDITIVGEAADGYEALELVEELAPDVVVMDIAMPRLTGIQAAERICTSDHPTCVVILSMYSDETLVRQALRSGVRGYVLKSSLAEELVLSIRVARKGQVYLSPTINRAMVAEYLNSDKTRARTPFDRLSPRERQVLQLIAEGHTNTAVAQMLEISIKTVEKHRSNLMLKLQVGDVTRLVRVAIKHGLIFLDQ